MASGWCSDNIRPWYEDHVYWDQAMQAPPSVLDNVQDNARAVLRSGWRPPYSDGPSRDELAAALTAAVSDPERQAVHA
jgi:hypothetical protein